MARHTITDAARLMGVSKASLRSRVQRGTIDAIKDSAGVWQIEVPDASSAIPYRDSLVTDDASALQRDVQRLEGEVQFLRERLAARDRDVERLTQSLLAFTMQGRAILSDGQHEPQSIEGEQIPLATETDAQRGAQTPRRGILQSVRRWIIGREGE